MNNQLTPNLNQNQHNIFQKIAYGELPLYILYWGFGVGGGLILSLIFNQIDIKSKFLIDLFLLAVLFYQFFISIGIWRAANNYRKSIFLAWLAKVLTIIGTIIIVITVFGFKSFDNIQHSITQSPNTSRYHTAPDTIVRDEKLFGKKMGATWNWKKLDVEKSNWWLETSMRKHDKFNLINIWLKTESLERAKLQGADYNYTVIDMTLSCSDATYHMNSVTDVFYDKNRADEDLVFREQFDKKFIKIDSTRKHLVKTYNIVCTPRS